MRTVSLRRAASSSSLLRSGDASASGAGVAPTLGMAVPGMAVPGVAVPGVAGVAGGAAAEASGLVR